MLAEKFFDLGREGAKDPKVTCLMGKHFDPEGIKECRLVFWAHTP